MFHTQALLKEVQARKSLVDTLNEVSSALLELVPWRARAGLDKLITEDNERYRSASDAISQHVDQTGAAILKSQQVKCCKNVNANKIDHVQQITRCLLDFPQGRQLRKSMTGQSDCSVVARSF